MNIRRFGAAVICASTCSVIAAPVAYADELYGSSNNNVGSPGPGKTAYYDYVVIDPATGYGKGGFSQYPTSYR